MAELGTRWAPLSEVTGAPVSLRHGVALLRTAEPEATVLWLVGPQITVLAYGIPTYREPMMPLDSDAGLDAYARMQLIRHFEEMIRSLHGAGKLPGFMHVSVGQEAVPVGVSLALRPDDYIATTHRGHGDVIAKGVEVEGMFAELFARAGGVCRAKGGSMHITDFSKGVLGAFSIVAAGLPIAVGAGLAMRRRGRDTVVVAHFGDGAIAQGATHESLNMATLWRLPVIFVRHNNQYAESTPTRDYQGIPDVVDYAATYGMPAHEVDGNDVEAVFDAASEAIHRARVGDGPTFLECQTYRWYGHNIGDPGAGRPEDEVAAWKARDPIASWRSTLLDRAFVDEDQLLDIDRGIERRIETAIEAAEAMPDPPLEWALEDVYSDPAVLEVVGGGLR